MLTFIVLVDFSVAAANALHYAVVLARHLAGHVRVVHVLPDLDSPERPFLQSPFAGRRVAQAQQALVRLGQEIAPYVSSSCELLQGPLAEELEQWSGSVVVVGNGNLHKSAAEAQRSTILYLAQQLQQPLLMVPAPYKPAGLPQRLMLNTDRHPVHLPADVKAIVPELLAQLAGAYTPLTLAASTRAAVEELLWRLQPAVVGLHVHTSAYSPTVAEVASNIQQMGLLPGLVEAVTTAHFPCVEEGIRHAAVRHGTDLLSFVARRPPATAQAFYASVTAGLLTRSCMPVLAVPEA